MIINSKFHDYYDSLAGQYRDEKVIYNRAEVTFYRSALTYNKLVHGPIPSRFFDIINKYCRIGTELRGFNNPRSEVRDWMGVVLFCGKIFPFSTSQTDRSPNFSDPYKEIGKPEKYLRSEFVRIDNYDCREGIEDTLAVELCQEYGPIIYIDYQYDWYVQVNRSLKEVKFHLDAYTAYQSILSFLTAHNPVIPEMDDETKIVSKGFDDMSFKREKGGPTRKRKKLV